MKEEFPAIIHFYATFFECVSVYTYVYVCLCIYTYLLIQFSTSLLASFRL